jgi:hypothetical protein
MVVFSKLIKFVISKEITKKKQKTQRWPFNTGLTVIITEVLLSNHFDMVSFLFVLLLYWSLFQNDCYTKKKWSFKTGDILKEVQFIWSGMFGDFLNLVFFFIYPRNPGTNIQRILASCNSLICVVTSLRRSI